MSLKDTLLGYRFKIMNESAYYCSHWFGEWKLHAPLTLKIKIAIKLLDEGELTPETFPEYHNLSEEEKIEARILMQDLLGEDPWIHEPFTAAELDEISKVKVDELIDWEKSKMTIISKEEKFAKDEESFKEFQAGHISREQHLIDTGWYEDDTEIIIKIIREATHYLDLDEQASNSYDANWIEKNMGDCVKDLKQLTECLRLWREKTKTYYANLKREKTK